MCINIIELNFLQFEVGDISMRIWNGRRNDDGSIHCLGNGRVCCYEQGPEVIQLFGPPYSSPSLIQLLFADQDLQVESQREVGTEVWVHSIIRDGQRVGEMSDFTASGIDCFARKISSTESISLTFDMAENTFVTDNSKLFIEKGFAGGFLLYSPAGGTIYNDYPLPKKVYYQILLSGDIKVNSLSGKTVEVRAEKGNSEIYIIGGNDSKECNINTQKVIEVGFDNLLRDTLSWWKQFSSQRYDFDSAIEGGFTLRRELLDAVDSVSGLIKAQQGEEGGVLAGYNYHMGYVRDQYGVSRCLLKLGYNEEAKEIINFYWKVWNNFGRIHNAQCMGVPGIFHVHENDEVEITGYLIIQAFDYLEKTGDAAFVNEIFPMLEWAFEAQKKYLVKGMLPFNGDETYIAGGVLPRTAMNDGSAEATLLFITGGEKLIKLAEEKGIWNNERIKDNSLILLETKGKYRENFLINGILATNNPLRKVGLSLPTFRHGVCESCIVSEKDIRPFTFGWTQKNENDRYLCPECLVENNLPRVEDKVYFLRSVTLMPLYIGSDLLSIEEITGMVEEIVEDYKKTGRFPSRPDGNITVGYDYGLFLYSLNKLVHPLAGEIYKKMLSVIDPTGSWVEYYEDGKPFNTRCRPWESGINLEAALNYAMKK